MFLFPSLRESACNYMSVCAIIPTKGGESMKSYSMILVHYHTWREIHFEDFRKDTDRDAQFYVIEKAKELIKEQWPSYSFIFFSPQKLPSDDSIIFNIFNPDTNGMLFKLRYWENPL